LKIAPAHVEFRRAHLFNVNPVGFGSMVVAGAVSVAAYFGAFGSLLAELAPFVSLVIALVLPPVLAVATRGRYYTARTSEFPEGATEATCAVCDGTFDLIDMATCPFHSGAICSLCCSTEGACHDACKPSAWRPVPGGPTELGMPRPRVGDRIPATTSAVVTVQEATS
jgi:hypothetical protein